MPILAKTYQGIQGGMNQAVPQHEIPDGQASYMQDIILNLPGIIKRRGPLTKVSGSATVPFRAVGIASVQNPAGVFKILVMGGGASTANLYFYNTALSSTTAYSMPATGGLTAFKTNPRSLVDAKPALSQGAIIGTSQGYVPGAAEAGIIYWRGAALSADLAVNAVTTTVGSKNVTTVNSFAGVTPGTFLYNDILLTFLGTVESVQSNTALTLELPAPVGGLFATVKFLPIRPLRPKVMKGRISIAPGSLIVNGTQGPEGTKFKSQGLDTTVADRWQLFRLSDNAPIGTVLSVTDNATLTLAVAPGNLLPATSPGMTNERYYAIKTTTANPLTYTILNDQYLLPVVGFLNSVWNGRQWYANIPTIRNGENLSSRVWFSDIADPEGLDLSPDDGDFMDVGSTTGSQTPITAIQGIPAGLLVFKETELFMITGSDYSNFAVRKMADTGCLGVGSVQPAGAGAIWAGREGIFYTDGTSIKNLSSQLGDFWTTGMAPFSTANNRMGSYIWKNQYVLHIDSFASGFALHKAGATSGPGTFTFCINLDTFAITTFTNMVIKDSTGMPSSSGFPTLAIVDDGNTPGTTWVIDTSKTHSVTASGPDTITCGDSAIIGPDFYIETKKYDLGDPERKKLFKQIAMNYLLTGNTLAMDTVPGLNQVGTAINTTWATQASWANLRKKFTKRDTHIQFRFYQSSSAVTDVQIGPFAIGFKLQRVGRV